jgi:hypothetical protein
VVPKPCQLSHFVITPVGPSRVRPGKRSTRRRCAMSRSPSGSASSSTSDRCSVPWGVRTTRSQVRSPSRTSRSQASALGSVAASESARAPASSWWSAPAPVWSWSEVQRPPSGRWRLAIRRRLRRSRAAGTGRRRRISSSESYRRRQTEHVLPFCEHALQREQSLQAVQRPVVLQAAACVSWWPAGTVKTRAMPASVRNAIRRLTTTSKEGEPWGNASAQ